MRKRTLRRWSSSEEKILLNQIRVFPQNLARCFSIVAEETGRTPLAVANHWYTKVSKNPEALCFFTASPRHIAKNRKNGMGITTTENLWRKFMRIINIFVRE